MRRQQNRQAEPKILLADIGRGSGALERNLAAIRVEIDRERPIIKYVNMRFPLFWIGLSLAIPAIAAAPADSPGQYSGFKRSLGAKNTHGYKVVSAPEPVREGEVSERFELRTGDCTSTPLWNDCANDRERSELKQQPPYSFPGKNYWYSFSLFVPASYKSIHPTKVALGQFHQEGANSPPLMFQNGKGGYWLDLNQTRQRAKLLIEEKDLRGRWHDILVNAHWSKGKDGFVKVWVNGKQKFSREGANLIQDGPIYFKYGIYRSFLSRNKNKHPDQVVYFDNVKWGTKREDVEAGKP